MYSDSFANSRYYNNLVNKIVNAGRVKVFYMSLEKFVAAEVKHPSRCQASEVDEDVRVCNE